MVKRTEKSQNHLIDLQFTFKGQEVEIRKARGQGERKSRGQTTSGEFPEF